MCGQYLKAAAVRSVCVLPGLGWSWAMGQFLTHAHTHTQIAHHTHTTPCPPIQQHRPRSARPSTAWQWRTPAPGWAPPPTPAWVGACVVGHELWVGDTCLCVKTNPTTATAKAPSDTHPPTYPHNKTNNRRDSGLRGRVAHPRRQEGVPRPDAHVRCVIF